MKQLLAYLPSTIAILVCAGLGSLIAHAIVAALGWTGTMGAIAALLLSMFLAFAFFVAGIALLNAYRARK